MKKKLMKIFSVIGASTGLVLAASSVSAAPSSTPTEVIDTTIGSVIDSLVEIVVFVITTYTGYVLAFIAIAGFYVYFRKFAGIGK